MSPKRIQPIRYPHAQRGLGLVSAIFVITVLAVIITGMSRFFTLSQQNVAQEFLGARAITAAQAGIDLELACLEAKDNSISTSDSDCVANVAVGSDPTVWDYWPNTGGSSSATFSIAGLQGCRAEVFYRTVSASAGSFLTIDSTGYCGGTGLDGASRRVVIRAAR